MMNQKSEKRNKLKPRNTGITMMMDRGLPVGLTKDIVVSQGHLFDIAKLGFASSRVMNSREIRQKANIYKEGEVAIYCGGTTLESFLLEFGAEKGLEEFICFAKKLQLKWVEVSDGTLDIAHLEKMKMIRRLKEEGFYVISEVGKKSREEDLCLEPAWWVETTLEELSVSEYVILEAREGGTIGISTHEGNIKDDLVKEIVKIAGGCEKIIFEAPNSNQQADLIKWFGPNVNLGNIRWDDLLALETLRQGFRSETLCC